MKKYITILFMLLLVITPVFGASLRQFEVNEEKLETLEIPVGDAVYIEYLGREVRVILDRVDTEEPSAVLRVFINEPDEVPTLPLSPKITPERYLNLDLNQDGKNDFIVGLKSVTEDTATLILGLAGAQLTSDALSETTGGAVENETAASNLLSPDLSSTKRIIIIAGIILAVLLLFFIFKGDKKTQKKDEIEGGFVVDSTKKS